MTIFKRSWSRLIKLSVAQIWDVGGSALKSQMFDKYAYGADAILLVYDVTSEKSFVGLQDWIRSGHQLNSFL